MICTDKFGNQVVDTTHVTVLLSSQAVAVGAGVRRLASGSFEIEVDGGKSAFNITSSVAASVSVNFANIVSNAGAALPSVSQIVFYVDGNFVFTKAAASGSKDHAATVGNNVLFKVEVLNRAGGRVLNLNGQQIKAEAQVTGEAQISQPNLGFTGGAGLSQIYSEKAEAVTISIKDTAATGFSTADTARVTFNPGGLRQRTQALFLPSGCAACITGWHGM